MSQDNLEESSEINLPVLSRVQSVKGLSKAARQSARMSVLDNDSEEIVFPIMSSSRGKRAPAMNMDLGKDRYSFFRVSSIGSVSDCLPSTSTDDINVPAHIVASVVPVPVTVTVVPKTIGSIPTDVVDKKNKDVKPALSRKSIRRLTSTDSDVKSEDVILTSSLQGYTSQSSEIVPPLQGDLSQINQ